jgi:hypothetical protein
MNIENIICSISCGKCRYDISSDTLWRWIKSIEDKLPHYNPNCKLLSPLQIKVFFEYFGNLSGCKTELILTVKRPQ